MLLSIILASVLVAILNTNLLHVIAIPHLSILLYQIKYTTLITSPVEVVSISNQAVQQACAQQSSIGLLRVRGFYNGSEGLQQRSRQNGNTSYRRAEK